MSWDDHWGGRQNDDFHHVGVTHGHFVARTMSTSVPFHKRIGRKMKSNTKRSRQENYEHRILMQICIEPKKGAGSAQGLSFENDVFPW